MILFKLYESIHSVFASPSCCMNTVVCIDMVRIKHLVEHLSNVGNNAAIFIEFSRQVVDRFLSPTTWNRIGLDMHLFEIIQIRSNLTRFDPLSTVHTGCALWRTDIQCPVYECGLPVSAEFRLLVPECGKDMVGVTPHPIHSLPGQIHMEKRYDAE